MRIREIMTEPVETIAPSLPLDEAAGLMRALRVHHLVVKATLMRGRSISCLVATRNGRMAREKILHGCLARADAVRVTLGPKSKCVLIEKKWGRPIVCNDGVTIAKEFELKDPEDNLGVQVMRQAAERTGEDVGDGATTSTLLASAIFGDGVRNIAAAGASAIDLKRGLDRGLKVVVGRPRDLSRPVADRTQRVQVATVSAHNAGRCSKTSPSSPAASCCPARWASGGALGFADPEAGVGYAYVTNRMGTRLSGDPRDVALREALYAALSPASAESGQRVA